MYFAYFPKGTYDIDNSGNEKVVTNLMRRVKVRSKVLEEASLYDLYDVPEGETPEITSLKHFGSPYYHWVILMTNNITDRYYGWPLSTYEFEEYLNTKYPNAVDSVHHFEITQLSGRTSGEGPSDYTHKVEVNSTVPGATAVTNREYEERLQDNKRQIKLLNSAYLPILLDEFEDLIGD
jgi:hypothetical protein